MLTEAGAFVQTNNFIDLTWILNLGNQVFLDLAIQIPSKYYYRPRANGPLVNTMLEDLNATSVF